MNLLVCLPESALHDARISGFLAGLRAHLQVFTGQMLVDLPEPLAEARPVPDLEGLAAVPDAILARGHLYALAAVARFPSVPVVMLADSFAWENAPMLAPHVALYVTFSGDDARLLMTDYGVPPDRLVTAFVPETDLAGIEPLPPAANPPRRVLIADDSPDNEPWLAGLTHACEKAGMSVRVVPLRRVPADYASLLADADLVIAQGELAAAAAAHGRLVVIAAPRMATTMLRLHNVESFAARAFSAKFGDDAFDDPAPLHAALAQTEHGETAALAEKIRTLGLSAVRDRIAALERPRPADLAGLAGHFAWAARAHQAQAGAALSQAQARIALLERQLAEAKAAAGPRPVQVTALDPEAYRAPRPPDCAQLEAELEMIRASRVMRYVIQPWWDLRARLRKTTR